jgi:hypothetical protein
MRPLRTDVDEHVRRQCAMACYLNASSSTGSLASRTNEPRRPKLSACLGKTHPRTPFGPKVVAGGACFPVRSAPNFYRVRRARRAKYLSLESPENRSDPSGSCCRPVCRPFLTYRQSFERRNSAAGSGVALTNRTSYLTHSRSSAPSQRRKTASKFMPILRHYWLRCTLGLSYRQFSWEDGIQSPRRLGKRPAPFHNPPRPIFLWF